MKTKLRITDVLDGCRCGQPQSVGRMQVVPLVAEREDERLAPPTVLDASTVEYGTVVFRNDADTTALVPCHLALLVRQAAQDHAVARAVLIDAGGRNTQSTALCIQQSQGGYIRAGRYRLAILPAALREAALELPNDAGFDGLWPAIKAFNRSAGIDGPSNLVLFVRRFDRELARFVAEFECLDDQVGAVVLFDGEVMGVERVPSRAYWRALWEPLIRFCYGAEAARRQAAGLAAPPVTRVPLAGEGATTLSALAAAIRDADTAEHAAAAGKVAATGGERLDGKIDQSLGRFRVGTARGKRFLGSIAFSDDAVLYGSLVARSPGAAGR